jgi:predicted RNase H-like nuclease (RuvC/YqgF family)
MDAFLSGDEIVVDGVTVGRVIDRRSNEREALMDALRGGVDLNDPEKAAELESEVESLEADNRSLRNEIDEQAGMIEGLERDLEAVKDERDSIRMGIEEALDCLKADDVKGAQGSLSRLLG